MSDRNIEDVMNIPEEYSYISEPKLMISDAIREGIKEKEISIRGLAEKVGMQHPQIIRVTSVDNYNIDTLLKILNGLDLELTIKKKSTEQ